LKQIPFYGLIWFFRTPAQVGMPALTLTVPGKSATAETPATLLYQQGRQLAGGRTSREY